MPEGALSGLMSRHAVVGATCALLNICLLHVATAWAGLPYLIAAMLTCLVSFPLGFLLHRRVSFRLATHASWAEFGRFLSQQLLQFCLGLALLSAGVELLRLSPTLALALATLAMWLLAFLVQWRWVFRVSQRPDRQ